MKAIGRSVAAVILAIVGSAAGVAGDAAASGDVARLQGRWECRAGSNADLLVTMEILDTRVDVTIQTPQGLKIRAKGAVRLDETTSPRSIDWVGFTAGDFQTIPEIQGVYKIEDGAFVLCNGGFNGARPESFSPGDGPLAEVLTFRRVGPAEVADARTR